MPLADANRDGIPNLIAFSMGLASPMARPSHPPLELFEDGASISAVARRAQQAELYEVAIERSTSLGEGSWNAVEPDGHDVDFYGEGIDRLRYLLEDETVFLRLRVEP
jgi:hypothetical protein